MRSDDQREDEQPQAADTEAEKLHQEVIWANNLPAPARAVLDEDAANEQVFTKDLLWIVDAPVTSTDNLQRLQVEVTGPGGKKILQERIGKVGHRHAPHPHMVQVGDRYVQRAEAQAQGLEFREIMVPSITTVIYENGIVTPLHLNVLHALLKRLSDEWEATGSRSGHITTSRQEILNEIGLDKNGRRAAEIDEAFKTLQGLTVLKAFRGGQTNPDQPPLPEVVQCLGGIIVNYEIMRGAVTTGRRGRRADLIQVDLNPALVRALTGEGGGREWSIRSLNWTKTLGYTVPWRQQLFRMLDARFDSVGYFKMPLQELWASCLGRKREALTNSAGWREARRQLVDAFREFEESGYLRGLQWPSGRRASAREYQAFSEQQKLEIHQDAKTTVHVELPYALTEHIEWVYCQPGEGFYAGRPKRRREFAEDILACTTSDRESAKALLAQCGCENIVAMSYGRLKTIVAEIGERRDRLAMDQWLSESYPRASVEFLERWQSRELEREEECRRRGQLHRGTDAVHAARRLRVAQRVALGVLEKYHLPTAGYHQALQAKVSLGTDGEYLREAFRLTYKRALEERGRGRDIEEEQLRLVDPQLEREYVEIVRTAESRALLVCGLAFLDHVIGERVVAKQVPAFGKPLPMALVTRAIKAYRAAWAVTIEMEKAVERAARSRGQLSPATWEGHIARLLQRRIVERILEEDVFDDYERKHGGYRSTPDPRERVA